VTGLVSACFSRARRRPAAPKVPISAYPVPPTVFPVYAMDEPEREKLVKRMGSFLATFTLIHPYGSSVSELCALEIVSHWCCTAGVFHLPLTSTPFRT
jgi:hypothetical protein